MCLLILCVKMVREVLHVVIVIEDVVHIIEDTEKSKKL